MLYYLLKILTKLTLKSYFRRIRIVGLEKIPSDVPLIFIANHPSAFMDPIVIATTVHQPVYFIAAGEYVGKGIKAWIFKKWLHMIPVFRPSTRPEEAHKNKEMFNQCYEHLAQQGCLLIFPEGVSVTERRIKPFKTGVARIARGAELLNNLQLNLHIVPIGLNYSNPHQFRSDVFVHIGNPIRVCDFISKDSLKEIDEINQLTELSENALHLTTLHIEDNTDDELLLKLNTIYSRDLKLELGIDYKEQEREFLMQKEMLEAIQYFKIHQPEKFNETVLSINLYWKKLKENRLSDKDIKELEFQKSFRRYLSYFLGAPVFIIGFLANILPYYAVIIILNRIRFNETFQGSLILAFGLFIFLCWYAGLSLTLGLVTSLGWWALFVPLVSYMSGIYAQIYLAAIRYSRQRKNLRKILKQNENLIDLLRHEREELISLLTTCRYEFERVTMKS